MVSKSDGTITIKNKFNFALVIVTVIMVAGCIPFFKGLKITDIVGVVFACLWTVVVIATVISLFSMYNKTLILSNDGVLRKQIFSRKFYYWDEIQDYGLYYCGNKREEINIYCLYFSKEYLQHDNGFDKRLKGKMIKIIVTEYEYNEIIKDVIPFCRQRTAIEPFVAPDEPHFS